MTLSQVVDAINGYRDRQSEESKSNKIIAWETTRWSTWTLLNIQLKKKDRINDPRKLIKFDWDTEIDKLTPEQKEELNNRFGDKPRFNGNK